jgi:hypothetical protein
MLLEVLHYLATLPFSTRQSRPHIRGAINLWSRARRCAKHWRAHEDNTRAFVKDTVAGMRQRRTVVVLGSGLLRDVPIELLAEKFDTVVLVDLVHLASVRLKLMRKPYRNVRLIERDLSGCDALISGGDLEPLSFLRQVPYLDLVVSANLLSQLGLGAARQLAEHGYDVAAKDGVRRLISAHLDGLRQLPATTCLITDTAYRVIDRTGAVSNTADLLHGIDIQPIKQAWDWPVVPFGETDADHQVVHQVVAM